MPEPTAAEALLALAEHFTFKATIEQRGEDAISVWGLAAEQARHAAAGYQEAANDPGSVSPGTGTASGHLRDAQVPAEAVRVALAATRSLGSWEVTWPGVCLDASWSRTEILAVALDAAGPLIAAAERERIREIAERTRAVCTGDEGTSCYFADLIRGQP